MMKDIKEMAKSTTKVVVTTAVIIVDVGIILPIGLASAGIHELSKMALDNSRDVIDMIDKW